MPKPSELSTTTTPAGTEWVIVVKNGTTYKTTLSTIKQWSLQEFGMTLTSEGSNGGASAPTYAAGDVVGIAWQREFSIPKTFGGDEDGGTDISSEYTQLYFLPFNMGTQTGWHYPLNTPRFEYSGSSYNLSPDSSDFVAHHYNNSNENDYMWGQGNSTTHVLGSRYGYLPIWRPAGSKSIPTPILMFTDAIFNKLKESDGKLRARYYRGIFDYANSLPVTLNDTNYTLTRERVYTNSSYFKSGSTVTLNDSNYGNLRKLYVIKIS